MGEYRPRGATMRAEDRARGFPCGSCLAFCPLGLHHNSQLTNPLLLHHSRPRVSDRLLRPSSCLNTPSRSASSAEDPLYLPRSPARWRYSSVSVLSVRVILSSTVCSVRFGESVDMNRRSRLVGRFLLCACYSAVDRLILMRNLVNLCGLTIRLFY